MMIKLTDYNGMKVDLFVRSVEIWWGVRLDAIRLPLFFFFFFFLFLFSAGYVTWGDIYLWVCCLGRPTWISSRVAATWRGFYPNSAIPVNWFHQSTTLASFITIQRQKKKRKEKKRKKKTGRKKNGNWLGRVLWRCGWSWPMFPWSGSPIVWPAPGPQRPSVPATRSHRICCPPTSKAHSPENPVPVNCQTQVIPLSWPLHQTQSIYSINAPGRRNTFPFLKKNSSIYLLPASLDNIF